DFVMKLWLNEQYIFIPSISFFLFSFYTLLHCINAILINVQNGLGQLNTQIYSITLGIVVYSIGCIIPEGGIVDYNYLIILKIIGTFLGIILNSKVLIQFLK
ncbi:hypothetical protein D0X99_20300, partial [Algoriphagus lacus]